MRQRGVGLKFDLRVAGLCFSWVGLQPDGVRPIRPGSAPRMTEFEIIFGVIEHECGFENGARR